jgi:hypothetical protein
MTFTVGALPSDAAASATRAAENVRLFTMMMILFHRGLASVRMIRMLPSGVRRRGGAWEIGSI